MENSLIDKMNNNYEIAEKAAYKFVNYKQKFESVSKSLQKLKETIGGVTPFWIIMSFIGIPLGVVFAIYEANMAQQAIMTLLDPLGKGGINKMMVAVIGSGLAIFAMFLGHIFSEGLSLHRNESKIPFYFSIIGLFGYIAFQYYLVQAAGEGKKQFTSFAIIAIGVAILEILVGVLVLGKSISYMVMFFNTIRLWLLNITMGKQAFKTSKYYREYRAKLKLWNVEYPSAIMELEGNENIRQAIAYYSGISIEGDKSNILKNTLKVSFEERLN